MRKQSVVRNPCAIEKGLALKREKVDRRLGEDSKGLRRGSVSSLVWIMAGALMVLYPKASSNAGVGTPDTPRIEFSDDYKRVTVQYGKRRWTFYRPVVPTSDFPLSGRVLWVAPDGDNGNAGTSERPFKTINKGVSRARPGDIVYIKAGTYIENLEIRKSGQSGMPLVISAAPGDIGKVKITPSSAYVQANPGGAVIRLNVARHVWINGLIIEGPRGRPEAPADEDFGANGITWSNGAGYGCRATNNVIYNNLHCGLKEMGHGGTNILMEGNIIFENGTDTLDHGIYAPADDVQMIGNIVFNNSGWGIHSYIHPAGQLITHNIMLGNGEGGIVLSGNNTEVYHNVSAFHNSINGWGLLYFRGGSAFNVVKNNIFAFNRKEDGGVDNGGGKLGDPHDNVDDYNCYSRPPHFIGLIAVGANEVVADPLFVNAKRGDFRLKPDSPCIDLGDYVGLPFEGSAPDMGAFERR